MSTTAIDTAENVAVAIPEGEKVSFKKLLANNETRLRNLLPDYMSPERYLSLAMLAVNKSPQLRQAAIEAPETIVDSVLRAAQCGFEIGGPVPGAHLVPFRNKGTMECQMVPDYRGLINLAVEGGAILSGDARVVYKGEHFKVHYGTAPRIDHEPDFDSIDAGEIVAVYFVANLPNGAAKFEVMTLQEVDKIRARSKASGNGPWVTDFSEMAKKSVTKRGLKYVPMSPNNPAARRLALAIEADNRVESGKATAIVPEWGDEAGPSHTGHADSLKAELNGNAPKGRDVSDAATPSPAAATSPAPAAEGRKKKAQQSDGEDRAQMQRDLIDSLVVKNRPDMAGDDEVSRKNRALLVKEITGKDAADLDTDGQLKLVRALKDMPVADAREREPGEEG